MKLKIIKTKKEYEDYLGSAEKPRNAHLLITLSNNGESKVQE